MKAFTSLRGAYNQSQLRIRVIAIIFAISFLAALITALLVGMVVSGYARDNTRQYTAQLLDQANANINYYINDMESIASVTNRQSDVLKLILNDLEFDTNKSSYYQPKIDVGTFLSDLRQARKDIVSIVIAHTRHNVIGSSSAYRVDDSYDFQNSPWFKLVSQHGAQSILLPPHRAEYLENYSKPVISLVQPISLYDGGKPLGVVIIDLDIGVLSEICSSITLGKAGYVFIVDSSGNYIYHPNGINMPMADDTYIPQILEGASQFESGNSYGQKNLVLSRQNGTWFTVAVIPLEEIDRTAAILRAAQIASGAIAALLIAAIMVITLNVLVFSRLDSLRADMKRAEQGDLTICSTDNKSSDELGQLAQGFNNMIARISKLMDSVFETQEGKRKAELAALQSQINPHFLYNTMDTIVWMAEYNHPQAAEVADKLAKFFRLTLGQGKEIVTLKQEIEHAETYLSIQNIRYKSRFDYRVYAEDEALKYTVPKLIIQPLVENAVYHGIKVSRKHCELIVKVIIDVDELVVWVMDDGVGMPAEAAENILLKPRTTKALGGVGVLNVSERIKLYFGNSFGLYYFSAPGVGTVAELRMGIESNF